MRRIFSLLLVCMLVFTISMTTSASEVPDLSKNGTITVKMDCGGKALNGGSLSIYQVGVIVEDETVFRFEVIDELKDSGLSLNNLDNPRLAMQMAELAKDLPEITAPIRRGKAVFRDVVPGVYVVVQHEHNTSKGAGAINPFLASVPTEEDGCYNYDVIADPKVPWVLDPTYPTFPDPTYPTCPDPTYPTYPDPTYPTDPEPSDPNPTDPTPTEPKPTEPDSTEPDPTDPKPTEPDTTEPNPTDPEPTSPKPTQPQPDEPKLPQTGQLNWPVPIFVVSGMTLFVIGWILRFGRKKEQYEE